MSSGEDFLFACMRDLCYATPHENTMHPRQIAGQGAERREAGSHEVEVTSGQLSKTDDAVAFIASNARMPHIFRSFQRRR